MGMLDNLRFRIAAALSPQQMVRQQSKPGKKGAEDWLTYQNKLGIEEYDEMLRDPQIKAGYELIRNFLLSRKLIVTPFSDDPKDVEIAKAVEDNFKHMDYPMRKVRNDMYSALIYGYSVSEIIWGKEEDDEHISIKRIRPIPIQTLPECFKYDDNGDLEKIMQQDPDGGDDIPVDPEKCLIYTYDEQFGDREGNSILNAVYDNWYWKQKILEYWNVFLQKHEGPTLAAFIENPAWRDEARMNLDEVHEGRANLTFGMNDRVEVVESTHRGEGFKDAINYHDVMIFRKMNIGTLLLGEEGGSGAYAQSKTQFDVLSIFLDGVHEDIAAELQAKVKELVDMNWNVENVPIISFETFEDKDMIGLINALKPLIDAMAIDPNDHWFKQLLADVVSKYSEVDMSDFVEEEEVEEPQGQGEQQVVQEPEVVPTPEEQTAEQTPEQQSIVDTVGNLFNKQKEE